MRVRVSTRSLTRKLAQAGPKSDIEIPTRTGAMSIAGLKQYLQARPQLRDSDGTYVAIASDACNIEFETVQSM